jgi:hypothetical protein
MFQTYTDTCWIHLQSEDGISRFVLSAELILEIVGKNQKFRNVVVTDFEGTVFVLKNSLDEVFGNCINVGVILLLLIIGIF